VDPQIFGASGSHPSIFVAQADIRYSSVLEHAVFRGNVEAKSRYCGREILPGLPGLIEQEPVDTSTFDQWREVGGSAARQ
jgi:hypothetical protein